MCVMCVSVIPHQETGGSASGNWLRAALARVVAAAGFAPGINMPHLEYKSNAASHLTAALIPPFPTLVSQLWTARLPQPPPPSASTSSSLCPSPFQRRFAPRPILFSLAPFPDFRQPACFRPPRSLTPFALCPCGPTLVVSASIESDANDCTASPTCLAGVQQLVRFLARRDPLLFFLPCLCQIMSRADDGHPCSAENAVWPTACGIYSVAVQLIRYPEIQSIMHRPPLCPLETGAAHAPFQSEPSRLPILAGSPARGLGVAGA